MTLDLLRFTTAGSVDDGKSTLIGRLLYDSKQVLEDQLEHVAEVSRRRGGEGVLDLALLTDGLRAEREQGITIDVAYRYFASDGSSSDGPGRRFIIADVPGHKQYTRNMATGASTADLSIVLLDARRGAVEQSKRHAYISALLGIRHLVAAVNKMDLVEWDQEAFERSAADFVQFATRLGIADVVCIPMSALHGDNVVKPSENMLWYSGPTLLEHLETVDVDSDHEASRPARFPVQWVVRSSAATAVGGDSSSGNGPVAAGALSGGSSNGPASANGPASGNGPASANGHRPLGAASAAGSAAGASPEYRGYAGQIASGVLHAGDDVAILPSGVRSNILAIDTYDGELAEAAAPLSVTLRLGDDVDVSRGDLICPPDSPPTVARELTAAVVWMAERPLRRGDRLLVKHTTRTVAAVVTELHDRVEVETLGLEPGVDALELNDVGHVTLRTSSPLVFDAYRDNRTTGAFIFIDEASNGTVGAGMIEGAAGADDESAAAGAAGADDQSAAGG